MIQKNRKTEHTLRGIKSTPETVERFIHRRQFDMTDHRRKTISPKQYFRALLILVCLIGAGFFLGLEIAAERRNNPDIENVRLRSNDRSIDVTWDAALFGEVRKTEITVAGEDFYEVVSVPAYRNAWAFRDGEFGKLYTITVKGVYSDGTYGEESVFQRLFLENDQLPDLPLIRLETVGGIDPAYAVTEGEGENQTGAAITDNAYIEGSFYMESSGFRPMSSQMRIRIRGNSSALYMNKKPYKIELDTKLDLLELGGDYAEKEWILLNTEDQINLYLGFWLSDYCGMEWTPQMRFVNVMLNGDWKGLYLLVEPVRRIVTQLPISESGYLFENDVFWWNAEEVYFQTNLQPDFLGFTFKYPKMTSAEDERIQLLQEYMQNIETLLISDTDAVFDYIDEESFAAWVLVKDITYVWDYGGSNMYFYIEALDTDDPAAYQLKLGPIWDLDGTFGLYHITSDEYWKQYKDVTEGWSPQHSWIGTYTNYLMENPHFYDLYTQLWYKVRPALLEDISAQLSELWETQGEAMNVSRQLDAARWWTRLYSVEDEIAHHKAWLADRIAWIDSQLGTGE